MREGMWDYPWIPWVAGIGFLSLGAWFIREGAWWQWIAGFFFCCLGIMGLKDAVLLMAAKIVLRRRRKLNQSLD